MTLPQVRTAVRCRDGAFYVDPIVDLVDGYLYFPAAEPPRIVVWGVPGDDPDSETFPPVEAVAYRRMGGGSIGVVTDLAVALVPIPGAPSGTPLRRAMVHEVGLTRRIPRPAWHLGSTRYPRTSATERFLLIDPPVNFKDSHEITVRT
jgi:hypothetical protein